MTTPPIYKPGDDEYSDDTIEWKTSTPTASESSKYGTKFEQWINKSRDINTIKTNKDDMDMESLNEIKVPIS